MKNIRSSATVIFMLLLASMAPAVASAQSNPNQPAWKVLHLFERSEGDIAFVDTGAAGPSIGDRLVYSAAIFATDGQRVGRDGADCVIVGSEVEHSVVLEGARIERVRRIVDSLIGRSARVVHSGEQPPAYRMHIGDHSDITVA